MYYASNYYSSNYYATNYFGNGSVVADANGYFKSNYFASNFYANHYYGLDSGAVVVDDNGYYKSDFYATNFYATDYYGLEGEIPQDLDADGVGHARDRERMRQIGFLRKDEDEAVTVVLTCLSMLDRRM